MLRTPVKTQEENVLEELKKSIEKASAFGISLDKINEIMFTTASNTATSSFVTKTAPSLNANNPSTTNVVNSIITPAVVSKPPDTTVRKKRLFESTSPEDEYSKK